MGLSCRVFTVAVAPALRKLTVISALSRCCAACRYGRLGLADSALDSIHVAGFAGINTCPVSILFSFSSLQSAQAHKLSFFGSPITRLGCAMPRRPGVLKFCTPYIQRVLAKKRDPITHVCFLTEAVPEGDPRPTERMWESFTKVLANQMKSAFSASSFCKETFVNGYPKLAGMLDALLERLARDTDVKVTSRHTYHSWVDPL